MSNSINISFGNDLDSEFTLGRLNDGFSAPTLSQDMQITSSVAAPLAAQTIQTLSVEQENTLVDSLESASPLASAIANPSGCATVSVVWTSYPLGIRFGILAVISSGRVDAVGGTFAGAINGLLGTNIPAPSPTLSWSYMMDNTPDQPVTWIQPQSATATITPAFPSSPGFQLRITPAVTDTSIQIGCHVQTAL